MHLDILLRMSSFFFINSVAEGSVVSVVFPCGSFGAVGIPLNPGRCWGLGLVMIPRSSRYPLGKIFLFTR